jgi:DUF1009 family protein
MINSPDAGVRSGVLRKLATPLHQTDAGVDIPARGLKTVLQSQESSFD